MTAAARQSVQRSSSTLAHHNKNALTPSTSQIDRSANQPLGVQQVLGNQAAQRMIQPKLTVSQPNDKFEQEADRVADQVMRMPEPYPKGIKTFKSQPPQIQRACATCKEEIQRQPMEEMEEETIQTKPLSDQATSLIQRQVDPEEDEEAIQLKMLPSTSSVQRQPLEEEEELQAKELPGHTPVVTPQIQDQISSLRGGGKPLPQSVRAFFEPRFNADFSAVRMHNSAKAAETARSINARAFTLGQDIVFGKNDPNTGEGRRLLAHELTHVLQQVGGKQPTYQSPAFEGPRLSAHESTYTLQQGQTDVLRLAPDDEQEDERTPKAKRAVVVCGLGGKGKQTAGTVTFETDQGPIVYGLSECVAPAGVFENVPVQKNVVVDGEKQGLFFDITRGIDKTGRNEPVDFRFRFKDRFGKNPDPRTLFDFSTAEEVLIEIAINPHKILLDEIEALPLDEAGLRISEAYNEVELRALYKALEAEFHNARGKEKARKMRLLRRVEQQLAVAETQAERAALDDELGLDPEMSERIEDHPELASRLAALQKTLLITIVPTAEAFDYEEPGFFTEDKRDLAKEIRKARRAWRQAVERTPDIEHRDAADQALRLKTAVQLLGAYRQVAAASRGVKDTPDAKQRFVKWNALVRESLTEAEFLSGTVFIGLGEQRLEARDKLEKHEDRVASALIKLKTANVANPGPTEAGPGVTSQALAGELLRDEFTAAEVREALERLSEENSSRFDLVMASGQLSWAFLELAEARGRGKEAAKAELSSLYSRGQGFLVGYSLRAQELELIDPNELEVDLSGGSIVATVKALVNGLIVGFGKKGLGQIVSLLEFIAVGSERKKVIDEIVKIVTKAFTEERFRFAAGAAMAEIIHNEVKNFSESNSQAQAESIGNLLGEIVFEILADLLGGAAISAIGKAAKFSKMQAVLRLVHMTASNAFVKAVASKSFDLTEVVAKVSKRVGATVGELHRKIPGFTSQKKFADAVHDMKAIDALQGRVVDVAKEVGRRLARVEELAHLPAPDSKQWRRAIEELREAEGKLRLEVKIYNKKAGLEDTLLARKSSARTGQASQEELRAELELLYELLRFDKNAKEVRLFDDAVHVYKKEGRCWVRHSPPTKPKDVCLSPPKGRESAQNKARKDAAAVTAGTAATRTRLFSQQTVDRILREELGDDYMKEYEIFFVGSSSGSRPLTHETIPPGRLFSSGNLETAEIFAVRKTRRVKGEPTMTAMVIETQDMQWLRNNKMVKRGHEIDDMPGRFEDIFSPGAAEYLRRWADFIPIPQG